MYIPPPPDIFPHLSDFRLKRLYCDVCLKFHQSPLRPRIFAHRIVLACFSSFFADLCQDDITTNKGIKEVFLPPSIEDETMNFVIRWMYNEAPKLEQIVEDEGAEGSRQFRQNLRQAAIVLGIQHLLDHFDSPETGFDNQERDSDASNDEYEPDIAHQNLETELMLESTRTEHFGSYDKVSNLGKAVNAADCVKIEVEDIDEDLTNDKKNLSASIGVDLDVCPVKSESNEIIGSNSNEIIGSNSCNDGITKFSQSVEKEAEMLRESVYAYQSKVTERSGKISHSADEVTKFPGESFLGEEGAWREKIASYKCKTEPSSKKIIISKRSNCGQCETETNCTHLKLHKHLKPSLPGKVKCKECGKEMKSYNLKRHKCTQRSKKVTTSKRVNCDVCETEENCTHLKLHKHSKPSLPGKVKCKECGKEMKSYNLKRHKCTQRNKKVTTSKRVNCDECGKEVNRTYLLAHKKFKHSGSGRGVACDLCGKVMNASSLKIHKRTQHGSSKYVYPKKPCDECGKLISNITTHKRRFHGTGTEVPCEDCGKSFLEQNLKSHKKSVHSTTVVCDECGQQVKHHYLKTHKKLIHGPEKRCEICKKEFSSLKELKKHRPEHPTLFACQTCDYRTKDKQHYMHHNFVKHDIIVPEAEGIHKCDKCDFKSPSKKTVGYHMQLKHAQDPIKCPDPNCEKMFVNPAYRQRHYNRIHKAREAANCPECQRAFRSHFGLHYHRWREHRVGFNPHQWKSKPS